jgi:hypothetical protein
MNEHVKDVLEGHTGFGMGRRVCVGWNVGYKNMFIVFSRLLYCLDFIEDPVVTHCHITNMRIILSMWRTLQFYSPKKPLSKSQSDPEAKHTGRSSRGLANMPPERR